MSTAYISETSYSGSQSTDFIEVVATTGTDVSGWTVTVYDSQGYQAVNMVFPTSTTTIAGKDVYVFEQGIASWSNLASSHSIAITDEFGSVVQFISFQDPPATAMDGLAAGATPTYVGSTIASGESLQSDDGGQTYYVQSSPNAGTVPCFAPGMLVACPEGPRPVEDLRPGDLVLTRDHGAQPVVWIDARDEIFERIDFSDRPILIPAGRFGAEADLIVSPQHRVLLGADDPRWDREVLVPAKALIGLPGIRQMRGRAQITWHHFALRDHEVVKVNGVWTESLRLGPMVVNRLRHGVRVQLRVIFPLRDGSALNGPPVRPCLSVGRTRGMLRRQECALAEA